MQVLNIGHIDDIVQVPVGMDSVADLLTIPTLD